MATPFELALAAGLAVATVHGYFSWRDGRPTRAVARTVVGWVLAFVAVGLVARHVAAFLLEHVF